MLRDHSHLLADNPPYLGYGIAVADLDGDGRPAMVVCGFGVPNRVLRWDGRRLVDTADPVVADRDRQGIGVAAGDIDGDGREELYVLNTDTFAGRKRLGDRLFDGHEDGSWTDLFETAPNAAALNLSAGRSVCAIDRLGRGKYGFAIANYGGPLRLYELDPDGRIVDVAPELGIDVVTGGRALVAAPLVTDRVDLFAANENGPNLLFANLGEDGFTEVAEPFGLTDAHEHGRGVAVADLDGDGRLDLVCGNWEGPHRLWRQTETGPFIDVAPAALRRPSRVRTVIAADFDNDGYEELFFNNIGEPNRLFAWRDAAWCEIPLDSVVAEPTGLGTGAAIADIDGDGVLELLVSHGETGYQPLSLQKVPDAAASAWIRVRPLTPSGAPARGALVRVLAHGRDHLRVIDGGSGYLCQMEPVAHVGLGSSAHVDRVEVRWPDGVVRTILDPDANQVLIVAHP